MPGPTPPPGGGIGNGRAHASRDREDCRIGNWSCMAISGSVHCGTWLRWLQRGRKGDRVSPEIQRIWEAIEMAPTTARDRPRAVAHMFEAMDACRHLPKYKLEGRLAPYFELFLHDVLSECLDVELDPVVIPEFPLRKGTLYKEKNFKKPNESYNVDYVAFSLDCKTAFLVELKTDMNSKSVGQDRYLRDACGMGLARLVCGIFEICRSRGCNRRKYVHLLHLLAKLKLVTMSNPGKLHEMTFYPKPKPYWTTKALELVEPALQGKLKHTRVIYIQPRKSDPKPGFEYIYFRDVADIVQRYGEMGRVFAKFLRRWTEDPGRSAPQTAVEQP